MLVAHGISSGSLVSECIYGINTPTGRKPINFPISSVEGDEK